MSDLEYSKQIIASVQARLEAYASQPTFAPEVRQAMRDMADDLDDALGAVCMASIASDVDGLLARATEAVAK